MGTETLYEGDKQVVKQFHVFERKAFQVALDSSLADNEGELLLQENGRFCGANRTECDGVSIFFCDFNKKITQNFSNTFQVAQLPQPLVLKVKHVPACVAMLSE